VIGKPASEIFEMRGLSGWDGQLAELRLRGAPGRVFEANRAVISDDDGEAIGGVVSLRDVTARKEAEELQRTFFSVVSHELKTPIAVIRGFAELLAEDRSGEQAEASLHIVQEEAAKLSRMVDNLLDATRIQAGVLALQREDVSLPALAERAVRRAEAARASHRYALACDETSPVLGDPERLSQVLDNLLDNAAKYAPPGSRISVAVHDAEDGAAVTVCDEGGGVPSEDRERIFERFSRLDARSVRAAQGAGLGLYICKAIIEAHRGLIWVGDSPGGGACFGFSLPKRAQPGLPEAIALRGLLAAPEAAA
jgi:signal transduction histidine kinase